VGQRRRPRARIPTAVRAIRWRSVKRWPLAFGLSARRVSSSPVATGACGNTLGGITVQYRSEVAEAREDSGMATVNLTGENFEEVVSSNDTVLVDFWAAWCGPCRAFAPVFEAASTEHPDIVFAKVDTEAERGLAGSFGIMSIPTLMVFREQVLVYSRPGALPAASLEELVGQVGALDMDEVHRQVAAARAKRPA